MQNKTRGVVGNKEGLGGELKVKSQKIQVIVFENIKKAYAGL